MRIQRGQSFIDIQWNLDINPNEIENAFEIIDFLEVRINGVPFHCVIERIPQGGIYECSVVQQRDPFQTGDMFTVTQQNIFGHSL